MARLSKVQAMEEIEHEEETQDADPSSVHMLTLTKRDRRHQSPGVPT